MKLSDINNLGKYLISSVSFGNYSHRIMELGFVAGQIIDVLKVSPKQSLYLVSIRNYKLIIRKEIAELINILEANYE